MTNQISHVFLRWINCENHTMSCLKSWTSEQKKQGET